MTAFTKSQLPDNIDTTEKLIVWALTVNQFINGQKLVYETSTQQVNVSDAQVWTVRDNAGNVQYRFIGRASIQINAAFLQGLKPWLNAIALDTASIPAQFSVL